VPALVAQRKGKVCGDRGSISQALFDPLFAQGVQLITKVRKDLKNKLVPLIDKLLLRNRSVRDTVNDQLIAVFSAMRPLVGYGSWHHIRQNSAPEWWQPSSKGT
jgi:hypothetical protein